MIIDGRSIPANSTLVPDICIVGAGAAGITLTLSLENAGFKILVLESGGLEPNPKTQDLAHGQSIGLPYFPLEAARLRCLGGSTMHWGGFCRPLQPIDFEERAWVPYSGWPITRAMMDPYYERAQSLCQLGDFKYDPADWELPDGSVLPLWGDLILTRLIQFSPPTRFGVRFRDPLAQSRQTTVCLNSTVVRLHVHRDGRSITGLTVASESGNQFSVQARVYVLAAGGIDNPRLLLASNDILSTGIGNEHDLVGRFFAEHIQLEAAGVLPISDRQSFELYLPGSREVTRRSRQQAGRSARIMGYLTLHADAQRTRRTLNYSATVLQADWSDYLLAGEGSNSKDRSMWSQIGEPLAKLWRNLQDAVRTASRGTNGAAQTRFYKLVTHPEQAPNPESRVLLSHERDALGMPRPTLDWRLSELDLHTIDAAFEMLVRAFGGSNLARLQAPLSPRQNGWPPSMTGSWHHCGTTRMHADPRRGVVDSDCRVHSLDNLYIAGASVFPTNGHANPTLTIVALALRLADHIRGVMH